MGTVLGAFLAKAGIAADLVARDKEHIEVLKGEGAAIGGTVSFSTKPFDGKEGRGLAMLVGDMLGAPSAPSAPGAPSSQKKYDIIFLLTKQRDNAGNAAMLKNHVSANGVICTLQNGIPEPALAEVAGGEKILGCICAWGAVKTGAGRAELTSDPASMSFGLGSLSAGEHPMLQPAREVLENAGRVTIEKNFIGVRWSKLLINAAFSGMATVSGFNFGQVAADKGSRQCALYVIKECINVCRAANVKIEPVQGKNIERLFAFDNALQKLKASLILPFAIRKHRAITSGMLRDIESGKTCEIDEINGLVSRWGKKHGLPTPFNDLIVEIVHSIERGERKPGRENLRLFDALIAKQNP